MKSHEAVRIGQCGVSFLILDELWGDLQFRNVWLHARAKHFRIMRYDCMRKTEAFAITHALTVFEQQNKEILICFFLANMFDNFDI